MAGTDRAATDALALLTALQAAPYKYDFYQAMRRIECAYRDKPRLGQSVHPADDAVRFGQEPSLAFAPSTLSAFKSGREGRPPRLLQLFFGVFGPNGPLPLHLTDYARDRLRNAGDDTFSRFADIFHHRMLTLFYRARANAEPAVCFDRPESDRFSDYAGALFGMGMRSLRRRDGMPDLAKLYFAGRLAAQTRNAEGLLAMLRHYYKIPVRIEEYIGQWLDLPEDSCMRLGESPETGGLGTTATIGSRVWQRQYKFRITFGPMGLKDYNRMLPGGDSLKALVSIVRNYCGDELTWDVRLILKKEEVPSTTLGATGRLGWTTWSGGKAHEHDAADLCLNPLASAA
jgi:type VI secretion system protein ImpH